MSLESIADIAGWIGIGLAATSLVLTGISVYPYYRNKAEMREIENMFNRLRLRNALIKYFENTTK